MLRTLLRRSVLAPIVLTTASNPVIAARVSLSLRESAILISSLLGSMGLGGRRTPAETVCSRAARSRSTPGPGCPAPPSTATRIVHLVFQSTARMAHTGARLNRPDEARCHRRLADPKIVTACPPVQPFKSDPRG